MVWFWQVEEEVYGVGVEVVDVVQVESVWFYCIGYGEQDFVIVGYVFVVMEDVYVVEVQVVFEDVL